MSDRDKDLLVSLLLIVLGLYVTITAVDMPHRGGFSESPGLMPGIMGVCLIITSVLFFFRSRTEGGTLQFAKIGQLFTRMCTGEENRKILMAMAFVGLYVFVGVPYIGYYISSAIFMVVMFLMYVKRFKPVVSFFVSSGLAVLLFLTFNKLFMLSIK